MTSLKLVLQTAVNAHVGYLTVQPSFVTNLQHPEEFICPFNDDRFISELQNHASPMNQTKLYCSCGHRQPQKGCHRKSFFANPLVTDPLLSPGSRTPQIDPAGDDSHEDIILRFAIN